MKPYKILLFILAIIAMLAVLSVYFPKNGINILGKRFLFPSPEDILTDDSSNAIVDKKNLIAEIDIFQQQRQDALNDTVDLFCNFFENHPARIYLPNDNLGFFDSLFTAMDNCRRDTSLVHILHYGDSQIELDRISGFLRQKLQERFGGAGAGLLPAVQVIPSTAIYQTATGDIERYIVSGMHRASAGHNRYGILGQVAHAYDGGTINFSAYNSKNTFQNVKKWTTVRLFVNRSNKNFSAKITSKPLTEKIKNEEAKQSPHILEWHSADSINKFNISFTGSSEIAAISLDGDYGVNVDNVPFRGSSGTFFNQIDTSTVIMAMRELNVKLILLQFGGNSIPHLNTNKAQEDFANDIAKQIRHFQKIRPEAQIVLIGPSDMSTKINGKLQTYPNLEAVVEKLKNVAVENGAAYWSIYEAMGGHNSMLDWVKQQPPLASSDYTHFSQLGADKMAEIFYNSLMNYYEYYLFINRNFCN